MSVTPHELVAQLKLEGITDERVLELIATTPRHYFIGEDLDFAAYDNRALPIDCKQTISQPYIVASMTQALLRDGVPKKVLEIGTGSGYQAAILAQLVADVYTVERIASLHKAAVTLLKKLGYDNIHAHLGDGMLGWAKYAPYDGIIVTAATSEVPEALKQQLANGGRMIIPVGGDHNQQLQLITRQGSDYHTEYLEHVVFVPLLPGLLE